MIARLSAVAALLALPAWAGSYPDASRVLSLGGAVTEIVYALGEEDRLIGRDTTSSYPPEALALTDVGYVRALSPEGVLSVQPDLILSEEGAGPPEAIEVLEGAGIPFETIPEGHDAEGLATKIRTVAEALGVPEKAAPLIDSLTADLAAVRTDVADKQRVMFILSVQGGRVMAGGAGSGADAIIRLAGAENAVSGFEGYKPLTDEAVSAAAPDVILMMNRGNAEVDANHSASLAQLQGMPALATTPAVRDGRVITMDGLLLLGFGPRTGQAARQLHDAIYGAAEG